VQSLSDGCGKIPKPKTDASPTHSSNTFPAPVSLSTEICFGLRLAYPAGDGSAAILRSMPPNMLQRIHQIAFYLNQYANLLMVFVTVILVSLTAVYVRLTSRTLTALKEASLREREALHFQEIKDNVIRPILSWIGGTVFERFTGKGPHLLTISGDYDGKSRQFSSTVDDPFMARHRLTTPSDPDVPDPLTMWDSTEGGRISAFLFDEAKRDHFSRELPEFDRVLEEVRQLTGAFILFANESAKDIASPDIPQALNPGDENVLPEWTNPHLLAMDCIHSFFQGKRDLPFALGTSPSFVVLTTPNNQPVAKATQPDKLKRWGEMSLKHMCAGSA
jgi:hypothetical protein